MTNKELNEFERLAAAKKRTLAQEERYLMLRQKAFDACDEIDQGRAESSAEAKMM